MTRIFEPGKISLNNTRKDKRDMLLISNVFKGNKEDLDYLIELGKELKTQDNLCTRKPLIFRIQDIEVVECEEGIEDFKKISFDNDDDNSIIFGEEELDQVKQFLINNYEVDDYNQIVNERLLEHTDLDGIIDYCYIHGIDYEVLYFANELRYSGEFLTRKAAQAHLEKFRYRYSDEAKVYCSCGAENEELTKLTEVLERLYEMNCKEDIHAIK